jgi:hypothetical protein
MVVVEWVTIVLVALGWVSPTLEGVATYYAADRHAGRPLYCDQYAAERLVYDAAASPWFAVDVGEYQSGRVRCGEWFLLAFGDGSYLVAQALDAGRFVGRHVVDYGPDMPIVADLPEHLHPNGGAIPVRVYRLATLGIPGLLAGVTNEGGNGAND